MPTMAAMSLFSVTDRIEKLPMENLDALDLEVSVEDLD